MEIKKINLAQKANQIDTFWDPKILGRVNQMMVKIARLKGPFTWHFHEQEDELFFLVEGDLVIELRDQENIHLSEGEMVIIPHGIEHRPVAEQECVIMMFEPETTLNTGNVVDDFTKTALDEL